MDIVERMVAALGFLVIGIPVGYFAFLMFRISIHQAKFQWAGALAVVTTLCGGGFLTYKSSEFHFGLYAIGFVVGFFLYLRYLRNYAERSPSSASPGKADDKEAPNARDECDDELPTPVRPRMPPGMTSAKAEGEVWIGDEVRFRPEQEPEDR